MKRPPQNLAGVLALAFSLILVPAVLTAAEAAERFVTGPADGTPEEIAVGYVDAHKGELGLTSGDLADLVVSDQYRTKHNGVTHVYLQQRLGGVEGPEAQRIALVPTIVLSLQQMPLTD